VLAEQNDEIRQQLFDELTLVAPYLAEQLQAAGEMKNVESNGIGKQG
jgi:hypothetical protein